MRVYIGIIIIFPLHSPPLQPYYLYSVLECPHQASAQFSRILYATRFTDCFSRAAVAVVLCFCHTQPKVRRSNFDFSYPAPSYTLRFSFLIIFNNFVSKTTIFICRVFYAPVVFLWYLNFFLSENIGCIILFVRSQISHHTQILETRLVRVCVCVCTSFAVSKTINRFNVGLVLLNF